MSLNEPKKANDIYSDLPPVPIYDSIESVKKDIPDADVLLIGIATQSGNFNCFLFSCTCKSGCGCIANFWLSSIPNRIPILLTLRFYVYIQSVGTRWGDSEGEHCEAFKSYLNSG